MGSGSWTTASYNSSIRDMGFSSTSDILKSSTQSFYRQREIAPELDPKGVVRECRDSEEHPNTIPVILALDVTGSMGTAAKVCAAKLDDIITSLYREVKDVEFMMMGIGDLAFDNAPIQVSQFESDIRILDQTAKIWFEGGGGTNEWESYTAAWWFGYNRCKLDCWNRGKKGIIITMGDELLNPSLSYNKLSRKLFASGTGLQEPDIDTKRMYELASKKFDIYHIGILDSDALNYKRGEDRIDKSWRDVLGQNYFKCKCKELPDVIARIIKTSAGAESESSVNVTAEGIAW